MSEQNKDVARRVWEEFRSQGRTELADELLSHDFHDHDPANPEDVRTPEGAKEELAAYRAAFPDMSIAVEDQLAEGDLVASRWILRATHQGDLMGIPATGKRVTVTGTTIARIENGKVREEWHQWDQAGLLRQVGAIPE